MYNNFKIDSFTLEDFKVAGYKVFMQNFEFIPASSIFTASTQGEKFMSDFGDILEVSVRLEKVPNIEIQQFIDLNGQKLEFKQDVDDTIDHKMNCSVTTPNFNNQSFFNTVLIELRSVQSAHEVILDIDEETTERRQAINPAVASENDVRFVAVVKESNILTLVKYK